MSYRIYITKKPVDGRTVGEIEGLPVVKPSQVHGANVAFVGKLPAMPPRADALVTDSKKIWIGVLTADCLPIFLIGEGMVGVVHTGWRGTLKGVTYNAVKYMSNFTKVTLAIMGVCICENCFTVGEDVKNLFGLEYKECFREAESGSYLFDLRKANLMQLRSAGVKEVRQIKGCTVCTSNDIYYSYRKEKTDKRNLHAIRIL